MFIYIYIKMNVFFDNRYYNDYLLCIMVYVIVISFVWIFYYEKLIIGNMFLWIVLLNEILKLK